MPKNASKVDYLNKKIRTSHIMLDRNWQKIKRKLKFITTFLSVVVLVFFFIAFIKILIFPSPGIRHLLHLAFPPEDLYESIVTDDFLFYEKGFTKTYQLKPKYLDSYAISLISEKQNISGGYKFSGKLKAEFFWKDTFLLEKTAISQGSAYYADGDKEMKYFKKVFLIDFDVPLKGKYKDDISVRLTVLEPVEGLKEYGDSIRLSIGVSAIP